MSRVGIGFPINTVLYLALVVYRSVPSSRKKVIVNFSCFVLLVRLLPLLEPIILAFCRVNLAGCGHSRAEHLRRMLHVATKQPWELAL